MRKLIAGAVLLLGLAVFIAYRGHHVRAVKAQSNAWSQTTTNQYGTFTNSVTVNYDPLSGSDGTAYITETLTGRPSSFMPGGVLHTPSATVHLNGNGYKQTGQGIPANQSPNFSRTWSFDLAGDCDQQFLDSGFCTGDGQTTDFCPIAGALFLSFFHNYEMEEAITTFHVHANERGGVPECSSQSSPADWQGLFQSPDYSQIDRWYRAMTVGFRFCNNPPCTGQLWVFTGPVKQFKQISEIQPPQHCTNKDKGYISGHNVTY